MHQTSVQTPSSLLTFRLSVPSPFSTWELSYLQTQYQSVCLQLRGLSLVNCILSLVASNLAAMASALLVMASNCSFAFCVLSLVGLQPWSEGLQPCCDGLHPTSDGLQLCGFSLALCALSQALAELDKVAWLPQSPPSLPSHHLQAPELHEWEVMWPLTL